jgi:nitroreductase
MDVETAIRTRRTHKAYGPEAVDRETLTALLDLGRWAPNHHLTNPWRFRVVGPQALQRLKDAIGVGGSESASKLDRAPTLVAVSYVTTPGDPVADEEDLLATGAATYAILLGAHARGLAAYWRTPAILREPAGRAALRIPDTERCIALLHLGPARQEQRVPERAPLSDVLTILD